MSHEIHKRYRPQTLAEVIGQPDAVKVLTDMVSRRKVPHAILLSGPSGTGKTTIARALRRAIGCGDADFAEINAAESRGIDDMRGVQNLMGLAPMSGRCRVWLLDEFHQATRAAQECLLKPLEDTPKHVYFFLASTDPAKIIATIKNRCTEIKVGPVAADVLKARVTAIAGIEKIPLSDQLAARITEMAEGSVRRALVLLDQIAGIADPADQAAIINAADFKTASESIAKLLYNRAKWPEIAAAIKGLDGDDNQWESIRWGVLGYASAILLNKPRDDRLFYIIDAFRRPFYDSKRAGLVAACYEIATKGEK